MFGIYSERGSERVEAEIRVAHVLQQTLLGKASAGKVDPISPAIVALTGDLERLQVAIMALSCLRFSDVEQVQVVDVITAQTRTYKQRKTGEPVTIEWPYLAWERKVLDAAQKATATRSSYEAVRHTMTKACNQLGLRPPAGIKSATHIFRHLRATWMAENGYTYQEITKMLGHSNPRSTLDYIHYEAIEWRNIIP